MSTPARLSLLDEFPLRYDALVRFLRHRTGNGEDAREIAHETWLRLAEQRPAAGAPAGAPVEDARAYLSTAAAHIGLDRQRRAQWLQSHTRDSAATGAAAGHAPDVADALMYRQALAAVEAALAALPGRTREAFVAHRVHGESQAAIAGRLGVSLNTIERDLGAASDRIETALRQWRGEPRPPAREGGRRRSLASLLAVGGLGVVGALGWRLWRDQALHWEGSYAAARGRSLTQPLPDGSGLILDAQSRIELAYDARRRSARLLEGAAFFAVQHDASRPFTVQAREVTVTVLGTRFGVEIEPGGSVLVQTESGLVRVSRGDTVLAGALGAGQGLRVAPDGTPRAVPGTAAPWRHGRLHFDAVPLAEATERLARYARLELATDARAAQLRISGTVEIAEAADWLQALPAVLPLRVVRDNGRVLLVARQAKNQ
ncbi:sigma-70 family RNA polymerase sigma factor [Acidovorax sp. sic0104]|uniref:sigma-70 family RNA polymerase sigma factor n=1 Tax=Acidovorax sp. sic0104 TaxID=2854784 RepID=UPI001C443C50|nr:sigma-70 family RNA polymerase sigma factor [Acidovorax sp. sic0104]MBV7540563.1 sigma-70 family RNA polymerase sigma factor [Acidovorax sp. sic0104]